MLLKVPVAVELMMLQRVPTVHVHIASLLHGEIAGRETADLRPCRVNKCRTIPLSAIMGNLLLLAFVLLNCITGSLTLAISQICAHSSAYIHTMAFFFSWFYFRNHMLLQDNLALKTLSDTFNLYLVYLDMEPCLF